MLARLGHELVARHETALSELVKNAYDADAKRVAVRIASPSKGNYIEVADDGSGMTRDAFVRGFMRLATNDKNRAPVVPSVQTAARGPQGGWTFCSRATRQEAHLDYRDARLRDSPPHRDRVGAFCSRP